MTLQQHPLSGQARAKTLGAAIIGLGIGRQHVIGCAATAGVEPRVICDLSAEKLEEVGAEFPRADRVTRWDDVVARDDIDLVIVASFDDAHCEQVIAALESDKHVFVEKPLCLNEDQLHRIYRAWASGPSQWLMSNLVLRAAPLYRWLKEQVVSGRLGEIYAIDGDYLYGRIHKITSGWRSEVDDYSVMMGGGIHMADLMLWLAGERPHLVRAHGNHICTRDSVFRYRDFTAATYEFPSGLVGRITANFGCTHRHQHVLRVFGTKATFIYDDQGPRLIESREPGEDPIWIEHSPLPAHKWDLIPDLVHEIQRRNAPTSRVQQEFDLISIGLAADQSAEYGTSIEITYL